MSTRFRAAVVQRLIFKRLCVGISQGVRINTFYSIFSVNMSVVNMTNFEKKRLAGQLEAK